MQRVVYTTNICLIPFAKWVSKKRLISSIEAWEIGKVSYLIEDSEELEEQAVWLLILKSFFFLLKSLFITLSIK
jgi:hypothetical protein